MARPDPALLDPARYPVSFTLTTRFQDLDPNGHINNVATAALFEDVRVRFNQSMGLRGMLAAENQRPLVVSVAIDYLDEMFYPEPVEGHAGLLSLGRTSWTMGALLVQGGRRSAFMKSTVVSVGQGQPLPPPSEFRAVLERHLIG